MQSQKVYFEDSDMRALKRIAKDRGGASIASIVREAVRKFVAEIERKK